MTYTWTFQFGCLPWFPNNGCDFSPSLVFFFVRHPDWFRCCEKHKDINRSIVTAPEHPGFVEICVASSWAPCFKGIPMDSCKERAKSFVKFIPEPQPTSLKWNHPIETSIGNGKCLALGFQVYIKKSSTFFSIRFTFEVTNPPWFAVGNETWPGYFIWIMLSQYKDPVMNQDFMEWHMTCFFNSALVRCFFSEMGIIQSSPNNYMICPNFNSSVVSQE